MTVIADRTEESKREIAELAFEHALRQIEACLSGRFPAWALGAYRGSELRRPSPATERRHGGGIEMTAPTEHRSLDETNDVRSMWARCLVGIDASKASLEAARQASRLLEPNGQLTLVSTYDVLTAFVADTIGVTASVRIDQEAQRKTAEDAVRRALAEFPGADGKVVRGRAWEELIREAERERAGCIVAGSHGTGRMAGIFIGSTATELVHRAPCSVLIARQSSREFPRSIVVGVDGSPESARAYEVAADLSARFGVRLWNVVAHGGKGVDPARVADIVGHHREDLQGHPVSALVAVASEADLLVVGSRGLHGLKSLGSVSERVAHSVGCSVLVVRQAPWEQ